MPAAPSGSSSPVSPGTPRRPSGRCRRPTCSATAWRGWWRRSRPPRQKWRRCGRERWRLRARPAVPGAAGKLRLRRGLPHRRRRARRAGRTSSGRSRAGRSRAPLVARGPHALLLGLLTVPELRPDLAHRLARGLAPSTTCDPLVGGVSLALGLGTSHARRLPPPDPAGGAVPLRGAGTRVGRLPSTPWRSRTRARRSRSSTRH